MRKVNLIPATSERVEVHTSESINNQIFQDSLSHVNQYINSDKDEISKRIRELDKEWDTERVLETNASTLIVLSTILGFTVNKRWFALAGAVGSFLLMHAVQGWCPPLPVLRRLGVRTASEINREKNVLKLLRGDYDELQNRPEGCPYQIKENLLR